MKSSTYLYPADDYLKDSISNIMSLFSISPAGDSFKVDFSPEDLPADMLLIRNYYDKDYMELSTKVWFRKTTGQVVCMNSAALRQADEDFRAAAKRLVKLNLLTIFDELTGRSPGPWGILRGVRPIKIPHKLFDKGFERDEIISELCNRYALDFDKAGLLTSIADRQRKFLHEGAAAKKMVSIYIGIPYCPSRCLYCSFPAQVIPEREKVAGFLAALEKDIEAAASLINKYQLLVESIYIGGGTPTSLADEDFSRLLQLSCKYFVNPLLQEFTVEAGRPDSINDYKIMAMKAAGVTRTSINPQTMQEKTLKLIGRSHSIQDIIVMLDKMRYWGIPAINMDIIVGLPGEGIKEITATMEKLAELSPDNLTVHTLALKKGSILKELKQDYILPEEETAARMLAIADDYACKMGMVPYYLYRQKYMVGNLENIGYAKPGFEGVYNIQIIEERQTIIGIGPAAATKAVRPDCWRLSSCYNPKDVTTYIKNLGTYLDRRKTLLAGLFEPEEE